MEKTTVAILGASANRAKYGNKSVRAHLQQGYEVYPVNPHADVVEGLKAYRRLADVPVENLDRISVYLPPQVGIALLEEIQEKGAREIWLNPGSESPQLLRYAEQLQIEIITACSIVNVGQIPADIPDE